MKSKPVLSVILPCYNEANNLKRGVLQQVADYLDKQSYPYEVIVSDDGSSDESRQLVKQFKHAKFVLLANPHQGKAGALRFGLNKARGQYVLFADMDQSTPIEELDKLWPLKEKFPIVIGSRGKGRENFPVYRQVASTLFRHFRKLLLLRQIDDTQCGFKLIKTQVARQLFDKMTIFADKEVQGWTVAAWDVEFLYLAQKFGFPVKEVKVEWRNEDVSESKNRSVNKFVYESYQMLVQVLRVRLNDISGKYDS